MLGWSAGAGCLALVLASPLAAQALSMHLSDWQPQPLPRVERMTRWSGDGEALQAQADAAASGITRVVDWPGASRLSWRWKVTRSVPGARLDRRSADDHAARLYVFFDAPDSHLGLLARARLALGAQLFGQDLPRAALCYVWSHDGEVGQVAPNPYTERVRMVVLDRGDARAGQWREHERNLADDYAAAFGHAPAPRIKGIALMSDTDNTGGQVTAWFAAITRHPVPDAPRTNGGN